MRIGILKADSVRPEFQSEFGDYPDMFKKLLTEAANASVTFEVYDVEHNQFPAQVSDCDGYVITGSKKSVYDGDAWILELEDFIRALHEARIKLVGICFGHQLIAQALGGKTEAADIGWGVGVHHHPLIQHKAYMDPRQDEVAAVVSHKDQVTRLPPGAELLATSEFCPNSMYQIGEHIFAYQGHPEFEKGYSEALINMRRDILGEEIYQAGVASLEHPINSQVLARWMINFLATG